MDWKMHSMIKLKLWNNNLDNWIKVDWIKVDRVVCSAVKENIYAIVQLVINPMCNVQYYDALIDFIGHYLKRDRDKYTEWSWKMKNMNLYLDMFSFIADIWPGS